MVNYNRRNDNNRFYIGASMVRGIRRVRTKCDVSVCSDSDCVGLFDFVMSHYAYDVARLQEGRRWKLNDSDVMVFDDEAAWCM